MGTILLGVYLILVGLMVVWGGFTVPPMVMGVLALVAGVLLVIGR